MQNILLEIDQVSKSFSQNVVLNQVSMQIRAGEIHALLGENGAGKSTLLNILSGSLSMDQGRLILNGEESNILTPMQAKQLGIVKVHQELQIIPELTAAENIFLGNEILHPLTKVVWYKKMYEEADKILSGLNADFSAKAAAKTLSTAQKQLVEIAKALLAKFSILILDEPTSSLTTKEIKKLFSIMRSLKAEGKGIIFVSHRLEEIFEICDRITVLRDGKAIQVFDAKTATRQELVKAMTGREFSKMTQSSSSSTDSAVVLSVRGLSSPSGKFSDINFDLHKGEILGFSGLVGSGRTEIMRAVFGADPKKSGVITLNGKKITIRSPGDSIRHNIAFVPEDRKSQGMIGILQNMNNVGITSYNQLRTRKLLFDKKIRENAKHYMSELKVQPNDIHMTTNRLSGGNQQKIVLAKWLSAHADILIMDEPTRGIDVAAKDEIYRLMLDMTQNGASIIMISSELPEVISLSSRILVVHEGKICAEIMHDEATEEKVLHYAMGGK